MSPFLFLADSESMNLYDIDLVTIEGKPQKMDDYRSKTLLIVNVASQCGFTPRYEGLQALYANSRTEVSWCSESRRCVRSHFLPYTDIGTSISHIQRFNKVPDTFLLLS